MTALIIEDMRPAKAGLQPVGAVRVEPDHPVPDDLQTNAADDLTEIMTEINYFP